MNTTHCLLIKVCGHCGKPFAVRRRWQIFCSDGCRKLGWEATPKARARRKRANDRRPPRKRKVRRPPFGSYVHRFLFTQE